MIASFEYEDLDSGWKLEPVRFDALNLLVGPSGVGKTRILEALLNVRRLALRGVHELPSSRWDVVIQNEGVAYRWRGELRVTYSRRRNGGSSAGPETDAHIVWEKIERDDEILVERKADSFRFGDRELPALNRSTSAVYLLAEEAELASMGELFGRFRELRELWIFGAISSVSEAQQVRTELAGSLEKLRESHEIPFLKLYVLEKDHPAVFRRLSEDFKDVFPGVLELKVATPDEFDVRPRQDEHFMTEKLVLALREEGVESWVTYKDWSTGMLKTLVFLIETELAPQGTVFLIDELENGLGVNCLPEIAGRMLEGLDRVQFIATSHHPRVINEIPIRRWKLVTRHGSRVRVIPAQEIATLKRSSRLEHFTQLLNTPEYQEAVS